MPETNYPTKLPIKLQLWWRVGDGLPKPETVLVVACPEKRIALDKVRNGYEDTLDPEESADVPIDERSSQNAWAVCSRCWKYGKVDFTYLYCNFTQTGGDAL